MPRGRPRPKDRETQLIPILTIHADFFAASVKQKTY